MQSVKDILEQFRIKLISCYDATELESVILLVFEHVLGFTRSELVLESDQIISLDKQKYLFQILNELHSGKPVQYTLGHSWFGEKKFIVSPAVLIPRPETEELVRWVSTDYQSKQHVPLRVFDFCTGSGCIAISLALSFKAWQIFGIDISYSALEIARKNNALHETDVSFIKGDLLQWDSDADILKIISRPEDKADILICNPPYIKLNEMNSIHSRVKDFEPQLALFVPDEDPFLFYRRLAELGSSRLAPGAKIYIEIHRDYANEISHLLKAFGFSSILIKKDLQENDRMIRASFIP